MNIDHYSNKLNCGHVTIGFLHKACWFVKYSVIIESKVTLCTLEDATPTLLPPGSLDICFCNDLDDEGSIWFDREFDIFNCLSVFFL